MRAAPADRPTAATAPAAASPAAPGHAGFAPGVVPPAHAAALTHDYQAQLARLWQAALRTPPGGTLPEIVPLPAEDKRFRSAAWREHTYHSLVLQAYLLHANYLSGLAAAAELPPEDKRRLQFVTRQYIDALSPSNFPATNPDVVARALETDGESLASGAGNLFADLRRGRISMSEHAAYEVGRNLAVTPGSVVFRNELVEVIQYAPSTPTVHERPLVIIPPCINKYYILDLQPSNSFVRHAVAQGFTTFIASWRNIPPGLAHLRWDDYLEQGVFAALDAARAISGSRTVNALGFCVGGTLLACALAALAARGETPAASATFLTTMLDFAEPGEIGVYVSEAFLAAREPALLAGQRLHGGELATAFSSLRANDLVWSYVVNNYLMGRTPPAFDLLHWNGDSANLPGPMFAYYLRELYIRNRLREPGALTMAGERIDLSRIGVPAYVLAARDDHIVPWRSAYRTTQLLGGPSTFVLGASGHIAGVVNPPQPPRRSYWVGDDGVPADPDAWLDRARGVAGSWWPHWHDWLAGHSGPRRAAPARLGNERHPPQGDAPGLYVRESPT
jgi:polyhydroxyalkanoate synthase